jgi:hypothetical protein
MTGGAVIDIVWIRRVREANAQRTRRFMVCCAGAAHSLRQVQDGFCVFPDEPLASLLGVERETE